MIAKENLFELLGESRNYHSAILTTFTFDPIYFTHYYLPKLRAVGIINVVVLMDATNYDELMAQYGHISSSIGKGVYTLVRQAAKGGGVFHPKMALLVGENHGLCFVGSGNLTFSGMSVNEEVWGAVQLKTSETTNYPLFKSIWQYLIELLSANTSALLSQQLEWIKVYSNWLQELDKVDAGKLLYNGREIRFMANTHEHSLYSQLRGVIGDDEIQSIKVVSPFYDIDGGLVAMFQRDFQPKKLSCWMSSNGTIPETASLNNIELNLWEQSDTQKQLLHAKIIQLQSAENTYLCVGSANASRNAWGVRNNFVNDEAIYMTVDYQKIDYIAGLGIKENPKSTLTPTKRSEITKKEKDLYGTIITGAELVDDKLSVSFSTNIQEIQLALLDEKGNLIDQIDYNGKAVFVKDNGRMCMVVAVNGDTEVSNRFLITKEEAIIMCNPNPKGQKLVSMMSSNEAFSKNIVRILEYVTFTDEEKKTKSTLVHSGHKVASGQESLKVVSAENFNDVVIKSKSMILSLDNIRIWDQLNALITNSTREGNEENDEEEISQEDIEKGLVSRDQTSCYTSAATQKQKTDIDNVLSFLGKYDKYLSTLTVRINDKMISRKELTEKYKTPKVYPFDDINVRVKKGGSFNVYSATVISVALIHEMLTQDNAKKLVTLQKYLISILGRFLLLFGAGYADTKDYAFMKKQRLHKDIALYALLSCCKLDWSKREYTETDLQLLILNVFDSFKVEGTYALETLIEFYKEFNERFDSSGQSDASTQTKSYINDLYNTFIEYVQSDDQHIVKIGNDWKNAIIYKNAFGFMYIDEFNNTGKNLMFRVSPVGFHGHYVNVESGLSVKLFKKQIYSPL